MVPVPDIARPLLTLAAITIPLALWKLVDIAIWLFTNVRVTVG